jgi:hypothetical protein
MPLWSLALRVLLSLSMAFNGVAFAGVQSHDAMHPVASQGADADHAADAMTGAACSEAGMSAATSHADHATGPDSAAKKPTKDHAAGDCCKSGSCRCPCMHAPSLAVSVASLLLPDIRNTEAQKLPAFGHPSPALGHLIRPPIG